MPAPLRFHWFLSGMTLLVAVFVFGDLHSHNLGLVYAETPAKKNPGATSPKSNLDMTKAADAFEIYVDGQGNISLPRDYRAKWSHLGSFAVAKKSGQNVSSMHGVYTQPEVAAIFNRTGKFPDGTVLVKEVRNVKSGKMTTGHVAWSTEMDVWFVMIKDAKGRFPESEHWGDGWGWALFEATDDSPRENVSGGYQISCIGCHIPAKKTDWIYMRGYPTLQTSKNNNQ